MKKSELKKVIKEVLEEKGSEANALLVIALNKSGWQILSVNNDEILAQKYNKKYALTIREIEE